MVPSYTFTAVLFATLAVLAAVGALQTDSSGRWSSATGVFLGLAAWSKQTIGAYIVVAFIAAAAASPDVRRLTGRVVVGLLGVSFAMVSYLAVTGSLADAFENMVTFPLSSFAAGADVPVPMLGQVGVDRAGLEALLFFAALGALGLAIAAHGWLYAARGIRPGSAELLVTLAAAGVFLVTTERYSFLKLRAALPLVIGAAAVAGAEVLKPSGGWSRRLLIGALACPLALLAVVGVHYAAERTEGLVEWRHAGEALRLTSREAERASFAVTVLEGLPRNRSVMVLPAAPLYYVLADRKNPTGVDLVIPANVTDSGRAEVLAALDDVDAVLLDESYLFDGERPLSDYEPLLATALSAERFELACRDASGLALYVDGSDQTLLERACREVDATNVGGS